METQPKTVCVTAFWFFWTETKLWGNLCYWRISKASFSQIQLVSPIIQTPISTDTGRNVSYTCDLLVQRPDCIHVYVCWPHHTLFVSAGLFGSPIIISFYHGNPKINTLKTPTYTKHSHELFSQVFITFSCEKSDDWDGWRTFSRGEKWEKKVLLK